MRSHFQIFPTSASSLAELLLLGHVVVASFGEAGGEQAAVEVVRLTQVLQAFAVIANRGVDDADQKVRVHCLVAA